MTFFIACFLAALTGAYFRPGEWYRTLRKPPWTPPDWIFPIAWSILYLAIAVSGWLVWRSAGFAGAGLALGVYALHLAFNALWSALFFGARRIDLAFADVVAMWLSLAATIVLFAPISVFATWLEVVARANPVTYILEGMRALVTGGWDGWSLLKGGAAILGIGAFTFMLTGLSLRGRASGA